MLSRNVRRATGNVKICRVFKKINWLKKSLHVQMKVKIAVVTSAGVLSGKMTRQKSRMGPQPSILAASSSSRGSARINWTIRKMKNASVARNFGTIKGRKVLIQPTLLKRIYWGTTMA